MFTRIRGALVIDGTGTPGQISDVLLKDDRILAIGDDTETGTGCVIQQMDAGGLVLCPGFIDSHTHSDLSLLAAPEATGKISQGVTTDIAGNCGLSCFPVTDANREHLHSVYRNYPVEIEWNDLVGYADAVERAKPAINLAVLCGHNTLRGAVRGYDPGTATPEEIKQMRHLLRETLKGGVCGLSTGLLYVPGKFADHEELKRLLEEVGISGKTYTTHLRSEGNELLEALQEGIRLCRDSGCRKLHISHVKVSGQANWHKIDSLIRMLSETAAVGNPILTGDRYPYTESMTQLSIVAPAPYSDLTDTELQNRLQNPDFFQKFTHVLEQLPSTRWDQVRLVNTHHPEYLPFAGEKWKELMGRTGKTPGLICAEILRADADGDMAAFAGMDLENMRKILDLPFVCCGSDESARPVEYRIGRSHPRGFGSFPRFFRFLADQNNVPIENIIARMTSLSASVFGLWDRGRIAPGMAADLVLFDPAKFRDYADFHNPHSLCQGIHTVWVNGNISWLSGNPTPLRTGHFLRSQNLHPSVQYG